eukprot:SAG31_NODE_4864_length_2900_cov_1.249554_5_plen_124_part_00
MFRFAQIYVPPRANTLLPHATIVFMLMHSIVSAWKAIAIASSNSERVDDAFACFNPSSFLLLAFDHQVGNHEYYDGGHFMRCETRLQLEILFAYPMPRHKGVCFAFHVWQILEADGWNSYGQS